MRTSSIIVSPNNETTIVSSHAFEYLPLRNLASWMPHVFSRPIMIGGHAVLAGYLMYHFRALATAGYTTDALKTFYSKIWNLFYSEYLLFVAV